ncbi:hypothetical protein C8R46DRAFT_1043735 [Mycena filopes]|nr:hypothetical protein C8R46DRAFT_1043735 [Mycena filopes]
MVRTYAFFGPYITGPEAAPLRARLVKTHLAGLKAQKEKGVITLVGPFFNDDRAGTEGVTPDGSFFVLEAETRADALALIESDAYYKEGLWDIPQIRLVEFVSK